MGLFFFLQWEYVTSQALPHLKTAAVSLTVEVWDQSFPLAALPLSLFLTVWHGMRAGVFHGYHTCSSLHFFNMDKCLSSNLGSFQLLFQLFFLALPCSPPGTPLMHILYAQWYPGSLELSSSFSFFLHPLDDTFSGDIYMSLPGAAAEPLLWTFRFSSICFNSRISTGYFPV